MVMETICYLPQNTVPDLNQAITPSGAYQLSYFFSFFHLNMQTHVCVWAVRIGYYRSRKTITVPVIIVNCAFKLVLSTELFTTYAYLHSYTIPIPRGRIPLFSVTMLSLKISWQLCLKITRLTAANLWLRRKVTFAILGLWHEVS